MTLDWQEFAAAAVVLAAVVYLAQRLWKILRQRRVAGCGACAACPAEDSGAPTQIVTLEPPRQRVPGQPGG